MLSSQFLYREYLTTQVVGSVKQIQKLIDPSPNSLPSVTGEGDWRAERNAFVWTIDTIDSENPTGSLEFKCEGDADAFFPVKVGFVAAGSLADVDVSSPCRTMRSCCTTTVCDRILIWLYRSPRLHCLKVEKRPFSHRRRS